MNENERLGFGWSDHYVDGDSVSYGKLHFFDEENTSACEAALEWKGEVLNTVETSEPRDEICEECRVYYRREILNGGQE